MEKGDREKRAKIGIVTKPIDQQTSGTSSYLRKIIPFIQEKGTEFQFFYVHYEKGTVPFYKEYPNEEILIPRNPYKASKIIEKYDLDLIHYNPITALSPIWLDDIAMVATLHGLASVFIPNEFSTVRYMHDKYIRPWAAKKMNRIFTVSNTSLEFISSYYNIDPSRFVLTYNGLDNSVFYQKEKAASKRVLDEKYNINSDYIFHISRYTTRKNPKGILQSFNILQKKYDVPVNIVLGGSGWENEFVLSFLKEHDLVENVIFPGFIDEEDLVDFYNAAEVFLFPSLYEGFGMPNIEAMACGCPVVTSKSFAIPEIVGNAAAVIDNPSNYDEIAKTLCRVLRNKNYKNELIKKGLSRYTDFSWEESADKVLEVYRSLTV